MSTNHVFVYGTLKQGYGNHRILSSSKLIGPGKTTEGQYIMLDGGYPMVLKGGQFNVKGELYEIDSPVTLRNLDWLEGVPNLYTRETVHVRLDNGDVVESYMYIGTGKYKGTSPQIIPDSDNNLEWE